MSKKTKLPREYRETPEQHRKRLNDEAGRFRARVETPKTTYNRKRMKHDSYNSSIKEGD